MFDTPEELIRSPEVDAVYIATPPSAHFPLAMQVAQAGKPCCVEKPMAMCHAEAAEMTRAFNAVEQPLFVAYYRRSLPRFQQVKKWVEQGAVGEVRHVHWTLTRAPTGADLSGKPNWRTDDAEAPGGYFNDLACHGLDLFDFLVAPIKQASGFARNQQGLYRVPDSVAAAWVHDGGATGSGLWNFGAFKNSDEVQVVGASGIIRFSVFDEAPVQLETSGGAEILEIANPDPVQLPHVESMMLHLAGRALHPSLAQSAARTEAVVDQILARNSH